MKSINNFPSRDSFREMMDSITRPFPQCVDYLVDNITLDPHFNEFFQWALANNIPTVVVSSGMTPVIRGILQKLVGPDCDKIDIICNEAVPRDGKSMDEEGGWQIQYHDDRWVFLLLAYHCCKICVADIFTAVSATTSPSLSAPTPSSQLISARLSSTPATASLTFPPRARLISSSPRRATVSRAIL